MTVIEVAERERERESNGESRFAVYWKEVGCFLPNPIVVKDHT